eukprot:5612583-Alexandrium_andersonii.AAC.1
MPLCARGLSCCCQQPTQRDDGMQTQEMKQLQLSKRSSDGIKPTCKPRTCSTAPRRVPGE